MEGHYYLAITTYAHFFDHSGEVFDCGSLDDPEKGRVQLNATTLGSVATYICFPGYRLKGTATRMCTLAGWSGSEPSCERKLPDNVYSHTIKLPSSDNELMFFLQQLIVDPCLHL